MAKIRPYRLELETPLGECSASADTMAGLVEITPRGLFGRDVQYPGFQENNLDNASRELLGLLLASHKSKERVYRTSIAKAGCELDLVKCYLKGMSIEDAAASLTALAGMQISHSSVGRYWKDLNKIGPDFKARL